MRALSAAMALVLLSAVTLIAPEGPILASSVCGAEPHDPAGRHLSSVGQDGSTDPEHCADGHCEAQGASHGCEGADACCSHTHVRAIASGLAIVPQRIATPVRTQHVALEDEDEREGYRTVPSRPPSA